MNQQISVYRALQVISFYEIKPIKLVHILYGIRKFTNNDLTELYKLLSDEDVMEFIEPPFSWGKTANFLNSVALIDPPLMYAVEDFSQKFI